MDVINVLEIKIDIIIARIKKINKIRWSFSKNISKGASLLRFTQGNCLLIVLEIVKNQAILPYFS
jgi:hypothetical protein